MRNAKSSTTSATRGSRAGGRLKAPPPAPRSTSGIDTVTGEVFEFDDALLPHEVRLRGWLRQRVKSGARRLIVPVERGKAQLRVAFALAISAGKRGRPVLIVGRGRSGIADALSAALSAAGETRLPIRADNRFDLTRGLSDGPVQLVIAVDVDFLRPREAAALLAFISDQPEANILALSGTWPGPAYLDLLFEAPGDEALKDTGALVPVQRISTGVPLSRAIQANLELAGRWKGAGGAVEEARPLFDICANLPRPVAVLVLDELQAVEIARRVGFAKFDIVVNRASHAVHLAAAVKMDLRLVDAVFFTSGSYWAPPAATRSFVVAGPARNIEVVVRAVMAAAFAAPGKSELPVLDLARTLEINGCFGPRVGASPEDAAALRLVLEEHAAATAKDPAWIEHESSRILGRNAPAEVAEGDGPEVEPRC
jgi:hypothetical protein